MSVCDNEQSGAEPALGIRRSRLRHRPDGSLAVADESGPARRPVPGERTGPTA
ncbi:hypothetical protein MTP10_27105 [Nonomuraea sp. 3-1Str]|uniref:hypothetical protein n=1 Tax=Nonomuraea sp. 3-1Str TaxID=2929801 RepID=UPI00286395D2|nr:hypothetical protein [Nonomuraea sp. 3-1Str]MDR8412387.1 hypothetical protein [Nonomuraea sp. 3-1Str]